MAGHNHHENTVRIGLVDGYRTAPLMNFFMTRYLASYAGEIAEFIACIEEDREPATTGEDGVIRGSFLRRPSWRAAWITLRRTSSLTFPRSFRTLSTVAGPTPAASATSAIVGRRTPSPPPLPYLAAASLTAQSAPRAPCFRNDHVICDTGFGSTQSQ